MLGKTHEYPKFNYFLGNLVHVFGGWKVSAANATEPAAVAARLASVHAEVRG